jgi:hypothetical protein
LIDETKSSVCPGIEIPACSKSKNPPSRVVPFFNIPLPNTNDVVLSSFISVINLLLVFIYSSEYGTGTSD